MLRRVFSGFLALFCLVALALCPCAQGQESPFDGIAGDFAQKLKKVEKKHFSPKVLVIDFAMRPGGIKAIGEYFADQLSGALAQRLGSAAVLDRKELYEYLQVHGISAFDLADRDVIPWIAGQVGANAVAFGTLTSLNEKLILSAELIRVSDDKHLGSSEAHLPLDDRLKEMLSKPLNWPASPEVLVSCVSTGSRDDFEASFKSAGITVPSCIHCPQPAYTDEARAAKVQGRVKFDVVIDEHGTAKRIAVIRGDEHGLTARAMEAIRTWKFKPATKDGKPVTVCIVVEVSFRLF